MAGCRSIVSLLLCLAVTAVSPRAGSTMIDTSWVETIPTANRDSPSDSTLKYNSSLAWAPDDSDRLFVLEKAGRVRVVKGLAGNPTTAKWTTFATMSPIFSEVECGLLGIAFDPNFAVNHYVYFFVSTDKTFQQIIRYDASADVGTDRTVIVPTLPTAALNHDGGSIGFGRDGDLYWGIGDNGSNLGTGNDRLSLGSKIGRSRRDGRPANENPFLDGPFGNDDYIFAQGFRNPFGMSFQPSTGLLWVDVAGDKYEQVFVVRSGDNAGWRDYENNQPKGYITPVIAYHTNATDAPALTNATRASSVATFTTSVDHPFRVGQQVQISGVADASFDTKVYVASVPSSKSFTAKQTGPDATSAVSSSAVATGLAIGGAVTGSAFYDVAGVSAVWAGGFFFGEYNNARFVRTSIDPATNALLTTDLWAENVAGAVDIALGPDAALYYTGYATNEIHRAEPAFAAQAILITPAHLWLDEGGAGFLNVRLARAPTSTVAVAIARSSGDADVAVATGASLSFGTTDWMVPRAVRVTAAHDADGDDDMAQITASAAGIPAATADVFVRDSDHDELILSNNVLSIVENTSAAITVRLSRAPKGLVTVGIARTAGDTDVAVELSTVHFSPGDWSSPKPVSLHAADDMDLMPDTATVTVSATGYPSRTIDVSVADDDVLSVPRVVSPPVTSGVVAAPYAYHVIATGLGPLTFGFTGTPPTGMTIDAMKGQIAWTPSAVGTYPVTAHVSSPYGATDQKFSIVVTEDAPPICALTEPWDGQILAGSTDVYGDGLDDVGVVKGEFLVDGALVYTDSTPSGHYRLGGTAGTFDTTKYADGPHKVAMKVQDTSGATCIAERSITIQNSPPVMDAGPIADVGDDATLDASAESAPPEAGGDCGCRTAGHERSSGALAGLVAAAALLRRATPRSPRR